LVTDKTARDRLSHAATLLASGAPLGLFLGAVDWRSVFFVDVRSGS
jgi:hypothetical protein